MSLEKIKQKRLKRAIERFEKKEARKKGGFSAGKICLKALAVVLILNLNWFGLFAVGNTFAYFSDQEMAQENSLTAGTLDFSVTNQNVAGFIGVGLGEDKEFTSIVTKTSGSLALQYKAHAEKISGNDNFCNALKLEADHSVISYNGVLLSFNTATTTALGTWAFEIKLPPSASNLAHGEECNIDLVFEGWRDDVADFNQSGFNDEERIQLRLTSRMIVLNEFLPNPSGINPNYGFYFGEDGDSQPKGEWVELYNNSDYDFDLAGWYIWDASGDDSNKIEITAANTAPPATVIGAHDWLVVYMNKEVFDNDGDTVKLFNQNDELVDLYTYTDSDYCELEPTPEEENSSSTSGDCGGVPGNKSYARVPDGIGDWLDPIPTPGKMNVLEGENVPMASPILPQADEIVFGSFEITAENNQIPPATDNSNSSQATINEIDGVEEIPTELSQLQPEQELEPEAIISEENPATNEQPPILEEQPTALPEDTPAIVSSENTNEAPAGDAPSETNEQPAGDSSLQNLAPAVENPPADSPVTSEGL